MGLIILILLATIIGSVICGVFDGLSGYIKGGIVSFFIAVFIGGIILIFADIFAVPSERIEYAYEIYGLEYKTEINQYANGVFVLGIGGYHSGITTDNNYYFFSVTDYGKKLEKLDGKTKEVYIKETDEEKPCLKKIIETRRFEGFAKWMFGECSGVDTIKGYIIIVPTNTIKIDYEVDI